MLENFEVTIFDRKNLKKKILQIVAIIFFVGFTLGFFAGCSVDNELTDMFNAGESDD